MRKGSFAQKTDVQVTRTQQEIEKLLIRFGADGFGYGWEENDARQTRAMITFRIENRHIKILLPLPSHDDEQYKYTPSGRFSRSEDAILTLWQQDCRTRWRVLKLVIQAKLEAVAGEITTIEREFLSDIVLPDGSTVGEFLRPQLSAAYKNQMPRLLPWGEEK